MYLLISHDQFIIYHLCIFYLTKNNHEILVDLFFFFPYLWIIMPFIALVDHSGNFSKQLLSVKIKLPMSSVLIILLPLKTQ